ncbi:hypothetical protein HHK36_012695 [Tetracentron sinense]|uniref:Epidermal patterning factor-like protein n=1 Tax=Tetracentron sinense TaxID=13715 RepID=A0A834Y5F0_TETSI|nr:hypothetical protein HHK36_032484 [Tetracentron sinense]KAF8401749.1 hypothetical protein HHK36_012695 [Tetracentron sinense]
MGVLRNHNQRFSAAIALALLFFASASVATLPPASQLGSGLVGGLRQEIDETKRGCGLEALERVLTRRRLRGPGSSPPSCKSKCGSCSPCEPVLVPIPPGRSKPIEYYPEAWRCKCGNSLFVP